MTPHILDCLTQAVNLRFKGATFAQDFLLDGSAPQTLIDIFNNVFEKEYKLEETPKGSYYFKLHCKKYRKEDRIPAIIGMFTIFKYEEYVPEIGWNLKGFEEERTWGLDVKVGEYEYVRLSSYGDDYYWTPQEAYIDLIKCWYENGIYPEDNIINERDSNGANEDGY